MYRLVPEGAGAVFLEKVFHCEEINVAINRHAPGWRPVRAFVDRIVGGWHWQTSGEQ